jgi:O-antigen/teichoic acid export membrane protein
MVPDDSGSAPHGSKSVFRAGLWLGGSTIISRVATAVLSIVIGRVLGASALGQQSLIAYTGGVIYAIAVDSLVQTGIRTLSAETGSGFEAERARLERWFDTGLLVTGFAVAAIIASIGLTTDEPLPWALLAATVLVDTRGWSRAVRSISRDGWTPVAARRLVSQVAAQVLGIVAVLVGLGIAGVFGATLVASVGLTLALVRLVGPRTRAPWGPLPRAALEVWGMFVLTGAITQVVGARIEFLFLGALSTTQQVAMYSVPFMIVSAVSILPVSMISAAMPALAAKSGAGLEDELHEVLARGSRVVASLSLPITAGLVGAGPTLIIVLYGEEFREAADLLPLMALPLVITPLASLCEVFWGGRGRLRLPLMTGAVGGVLDIALAAALVADHGAWGATIANVVGQSVAAVGLVVTTWWRNGRFPVQITGWLRSLAVSLPAGLVAWGACEVLPDFPGLVIAGLLWGVVLLIGGATIGLTSPSDGAWMVDAAPGRLRPLVSLVTRASTER